MTLGELATMYNERFGIGADLTVVPIRGWRREMWFDETGLPWVGTSPNIKTLTAALLYPGMVLVEGTNLSEGRGTELPFEQAGAPWLRAAEVADLMNSKRLPGVQFDVSNIAAGAGALKYPGEVIPAVQIHVTDRDSYRPVATALHLIDTVRRLHPKDFEWRSTIDRLAGTDRVRKAIEGGELGQLLVDWEKDAERFLRDREPFLIYR
jgi:uncharacterized protein YbbC (DUF1343 family)